MASRGRAVTIPMLLDAAGVENAEELLAARSLHLEWRELEGLAHLELVADSLRDL
jgi:hypothetical protein